MGILDWLRPAAREPAGTRRISAETSQKAFDGLGDPALYDFIRNGGTSSASGIEISTAKAMRNPAVFRSVSLISQSIGMLPLHLVNRETKEKDRENPLFKVLHRRPNAWQTAYDFRMLMQTRALVEGNAFARIIRSRDFAKQRDTVIGLVPLDPQKVAITQNADWSLSYRYQPAKGGSVILRQEDVFHLRGESLDGIHGLSLVRQAADAIGLAIAADLAIGRMYQQGSFINGYLSHKGKLSKEGQDSLEMNFARYFSGAENSGRTPVFEEGLDYKTLGPTARDAQSHETRGRQIEEIARVFGVPRPLLMVDETSWGSGIEALGQFFVKYALGPWFEAWQQAVERSLLTDDETETLEIKFNAGALLRGSMKDQADYFAKALGAGGHQPWMHVDEVRGVLDLPKREAPPHPMMSGGKSETTQNEE